MEYSDLQGDYMEHNRLLTYLMECYEKLGNTNNKDEINDLEREIRLTEDEIYGQYNKFNE